MIPTSTQLFGQGDGSWDVRNRQSILYGIRVNWSSLLSWLALPGHVLESRDERQPLGCGWTRLGGKRWRERFLIPRRGGRSCFR